ncbi:hypothetical protein NGM10_07830 [Halorussus salilacus]|uniref:hypothetical protein n=1 Tax=Halorussus salilacus TaxID=2953750 RepID=UPI0020A19EC9|nr:hypothetical protein [Halorussus salilacus]USZ69628.1 hypothetical protein NGM10_07830 [Halorussus salilacus]
MNRTVALFLLGLIVLGYPILPGGASSAVGSDAEPRQGTAYASDGSLEVRLTPVEVELDRPETDLWSRSKSFQLVVSNPPDNDEQVSGFLYAGYEPPPDSINVTVAATPPDTPYQQMYGTLLQFDLTPGGSRVFPMTVYGDSSEGTHTMNATAIYVEESTLTRENATATVRIRDDCRIPCRLSRALSNAADWLLSNWERVLTVFSFTVAVLSFFGYARVRHTLNSLQDSDPAEDD